MDYVKTDLAPAAIGPYSQGITTKDMVFTSGQIPLNPKTGEIEGEDISEQTHQACKNVKAILEESGSSLAQVVKTTCFLTNMADFEEFNEVYRQYFSEKPARSCIQVGALPKGAMVEIEAIAELDASKKKPHYRFEI